MPFWSREESKEPHEPGADDHSTSDGMEAAPEVDPAASDAAASENSEGHRADSGFPQDPETDASTGEVPQPDWSEPEEGSSDHPLAGEPVGFDSEPADGLDTGDWAATGSGATDAGPYPAGSESSGESREAFEDYPQAPSMQSDLGHADSLELPSASEATPETEWEAAGGSQPQAPGDAAQSWDGDADPAAGPNAGEGSPPPPSDAGEFPASGPEFKPANPPYAPDIDSSLGANGDSVAGHMEPESDASSTKDPPVAPRAPSAPGDRIRELFLKRQAAANSGATPVAPISATAEPVRDAQPDSLRQAAQAATDVLPPEGVEEQAAEAPAAKSERGEVRGRRLDFRFASHRS